MGNLWTKLVDFVGNSCALLLIVNRILNLELLLVMEYFYVMVLVLLLK